MLVLARKPGENIVFPSCGVTVTVLSIRENKVRLGLTAPGGVLILREEVWRRKGAAAEPPREPPPGAAAGPPPPG